MTTGGFEGSVIRTGIVLPNDMPAGAVTTIIGDPFLVYLPVRANLKRAA
ncbi:hypothetical protein LX86_004310 [Lentzea aerocolonigenes]|nr:hypothetical protein [Lentzea aerocolonigenes]